MIDIPVAVVYIQKVSPHVMDRGGSVTAVRTEEEELFSGYETANEGQGLSGGCFNRSEEWQADKSALTLIDWSMSTCHP